MLETVGAASVAEIVDAIPADVRYPKLDLPPVLTEMEAERYLSEIAHRNTLFPGERNFLGAGSYRHYSPASVSQLLLRGEIFTAYTPYQPEVSQGTLQIIYEFQSLVAELMGMEIANASLYDGATAVSEATLMAVSAAKGPRKVIVSGTLNPRYGQVLQTYCLGLDLDLVQLEPPSSGFVMDSAEFASKVDSDTAAVIVQYPNFYGTIEDIANIAQLTHEAGAALIVATYPVAVSLLKSPGELGADIATAEGQSLGLWQSFGGPYLGLLAASQRYVRQMPGRLVGMTTDSQGKRGYVLTLQTREQHIRRDKATSNICTNQGLMATASTIHMSLLGAEGMEEVSRRSYANAHYLSAELQKITGVKILNEGEFFNEFVIGLPLPASTVLAELSESGFQGGLDLGEIDSQFANCLLLATTEVNDRKGIDLFAEEVARIIQ